PIREHGIDCRFERTGELAVATEPHQVGWLRDGVEQARSYGHDAVFLDGEAARAELNSPTYLAAGWHRDRVALVDPARLVWGLRAACLRLGVRIAENTDVTGVRQGGSGVRLATGQGTVRAPHAVLATNAFPGLIRHTR